jgi:ElaB/YqjD/DUF883 family membrane-anchored ribosome-binding protein
MGIKSKVVDKTGETEEEFQSSNQSTGFENVKNIIADKLHNVVEVLSDKVADKDGKSRKAQYGKQAANWLDHSAEYIRQFDYKEADASVRECVRQHPGRSLLIAGSVGLIIGAILRRR